LGIVATSIGDIALYRDVLLGIEPQPLGLIERPPSIAFCRTHNWDLVEPAAQARVEGAAQRLAAGASVVDVALPADFAHLNEAHRWITSFEFARTFAWEIDHHWNDISETLRQGRLADGMSCSFERYVEMQEFAAQCREQVEWIWEDFDIILAPAAIGEAPLGMPAFAGAPLYMMWTLLHLPTITLPVLKGDNGMPIGIQLLAGRHRDRELFAHADRAYRQLANGEQ